MVKILHVSQSLGGVANSLNLIFSNIDRSKYALTLVAPRNEHLEARVQAAAHSYVPLEMRREVGLHDAADLKRLIAIARSEPFSIIHCHSAKAGVLGRLAAAVLRRPVIYSPRGWSFLSQEGWKVGFFRTIERQMVRFTTRLVVASKSEADLGIDEVGFRESSVSIVNNSFFPAEIDEAREAPRPMKEPYVLTVSRVAYQKNLEQFIDVAEMLRSRFPGLRFVIKGSGFSSPLEEQTRAMVSKRRLDDVISFVPCGPKRETLPWIRHCQLYVHTSRFEALPNVILEAMAFGKAVVSTDAIGNRDAVVDGTTGYLTPLGDREAMARRIAELLTDDERRLAFEQAGHSHAWEHFDIRRNIRRLEAVYDQILQRGS